MRVRLNLYTNETINDAKNILKKYDIDLRYDNDINQFYVELSDYIKEVVIRGNKYSLVSDLSNYIKS